MPRTKISEFSATASENTDINSIDVSEGMAPSAVNNSIRELASFLKKMETGTDAMTSPDIDGGSIDGANIGVNNPGTGNFTSLSISGNAISTVPQGAILLWSGAISAIPTGYVLCDGNNSTPDLRDRFVVGADADAGGDYAPNATGGSATVTLTTSEIPAHNHTATSTSTVTDPGHAHTFDGVTGSSGSGSASRRSQPTTLTTATATTGITVSTSTTIASEGGGSGHENRPPYYALAYIMKS